LIGLTLEEVDPFEPGEDRGAGGRYYKLTPKLLGSSGHLQLGGELITLRLFLLLKVAIADALLSAVADESLKSDRLDTIPSELPQRFLNENGEYISGSLLKCVDKENPETDTVAYKDALDAAEKVLPTRWAILSCLLANFLHPLGICRRCQASTWARPWLGGNFSQLSSRSRKNIRPVAAK
jgi:hypothetical protein